MEDKNEKVTQKSRKNTTKLDLSSQDALILSLLKQHRRLSHEFDKGLTKPQQKVVLAGMYEIIGKQAIELAHLKAVIETAKPVMQIFAEQFNKVK